MAVLLLVCVGLLVITVTEQMEQTHGYCDEKVYPKLDAQFLSVCQDNFASGNKIFIDSTSAPEDGAITCECIFKHGLANTKYPVYITSANSNATGVDFEITDHVFRSENPTSHTILNLTSETKILFRQLPSVERPKVCLGITNVNNIDQFTVECKTNWSEPKEDGGDGKKRTTIAVVIPVCIVLTVLCIVVVLVIIRRAMRSKPPAEQQAIHVQQRTGYAHNDEYVYVRADDGTISNPNPSPTEQQGLLKACCTTSHDDTNCEVATNQAEQDTSPQLDTDKTDAAIGKTSQTKKTNMTKTNKHVNASVKNIGTENVYSTTGVATNVNISTKDNIYDTRVTEDVYNHLNEVTGAKVGSNNIYGAASGISQKA